MTPPARFFALVALLLVGSRAQHYCWPCAAPHGVVGKWTNAASDAPAVYDWVFKYLNNIAQGARNVGDGTHAYYKAAWETDVVEGWDVAPNVLGAEVNECGTFIGDYETGVGPNMTDEEAALVAAGLRLPTGELHQCPCAVQGRAHIVNGTTKDIYDWAAVADAWGAEYTAAARARADAQYAQAAPVLSPAEAAAYSSGTIFGIHSVGCPFHRSGPCALRDVEAGARRAWAIETNFSRGATPHTDNNLMLWVESLGPVLDAFRRDGVPFYPMTWRASDGAGGRGGEMFSALASPGGKLLVEIASADAGGRGREQFHAAPLARAVLDGRDLARSVSNRPAEGTADRAARPLAPLRVSRAVGAARLDATLAFYGVPEPTDASVALGFGHSRVLLDETSANGDRAVTLMLSPNATVHLQLWARAEDEPAPGGPPFPSDDDFAAAVASNQVNGGQPAGAAAFCAAGEWTVERYVTYLLKTHETVMTPAPADPDPLHPPAGASMDVFLDDHLSWDCTSPVECDMARAGAALYALGHRVQWVGSADFGWAPYSYDPSGYGVELHWNAAADGFAPSGVAPPGCFDAFESNGTCAGAIV